MSDESHTFLARIAESTDLLAKLALEALRGERTQKDMILYLDDLGIAPGRIAELLGTTTQTVYPTLSRARKAKGKKAPRKGLADREPPVEDSSGKQSAHGRPTET